MKSKIDLIKENIAKMENTCEWDVMHDCYFAIVDLMTDEQDEDGFKIFEYQSSQMQNICGFWRGNINGLTFIIVETVNGFGGHVIKDMTGEFEAIKKTIQNDIKIPFYDLFDDVIGHYIFVESSNFMEAMENMQFAKQRIINWLSNMEKAEFKKYCIKSIERDLKIDLDGTFNTTFEIGWQNVPIHNLEGRQTIYLSLKKFALDVAISEIKANAIKFIKKEFGLTAEYSLSSFNDHILKMDLEGFDILDVVNAIDEEFGLKCDAMSCDGNLTVWFELEPIWRED